MIQESSSINKDKKRLGNGLYTSSTVNDCAG
jgi:hypothetical protein